MKTGHKLLALGGTALAPHLVTAVALAQSSGDRSTAFQAGAPEDIPGGMLLIAAYAVVLVVLVLYVVYLAAMQQAAAKELSRIESQLEKKLSEKASPSEKKD